MTRVRRPLCAGSARGVDLRWVMDTLQGLVLEAYDRIIGLELSDVAVDGCITKAREVAANKREKAR